MASSKTTLARRRAARAAEALLATRTTCSTSRRSPDAEYDRLFDELLELERDLPEARDPARLADAARRRAAVGQVPQGRAPRADGLARQGDDRRGAGQVRRRRAQAARPRRAGRVRDRAEDRRPRDQPHLRERDLRARRDARRRLARRGRDAQPAHDRRDPALAATRAARRRRRCSRCAARSTCRCRASASSTSGSSRRGRSRRRTRATPPRAPCGRRTPTITRGMPLSIWVYGTGHHEGVEFESHWEWLRVVARARIPHEPVRRAPRVDRGRRRSVPRVGDAGAPSSTTRSTGS